MAPRLVSADNIMTVLCILAVAVTLLIIPRKLLDDTNATRSMLEPFAKDSRDLKANESLAIIDAYERLLLRRPTESELSSTRKRLKEDPTYNIGMLEHQLNLSAERRRMVKTQTNALAGELEGILTTQQVRKHIRDVYQFKTGQPPDPSTESFLYDKFVQMGMDHKQLIDLVDAVSIVPIAGNPFPEA